VVEDRFRPLKEAERKIFEKLFEVDFPGRNELARQVNGLLVRTVDEEGSLALKVESPVLAPVKHRIPVEARFVDRDTRAGLGPYVHILLHVVDGRMVELEVYKDDESPILSPLCAADLEVFRNLQG
jgi:hypothetical protein